MPPAGPTTKLDACGIRGDRGWNADDPVTRLRVSGTERVYDLPRHGGVLKVGAASSCELQLEDASGTLSREHALLQGTETGWSVRDHGSKNGLSIDGIATDRAELASGATLHIGGLTLIAEGPGFMELHALMCRIIGWSSLPSVDEALQHLRDYAARRAALVLVGDEDLTGIARRLHQETVGRGAPFHVHAGNDMQASIAAAMQGTLCVPVLRRPAASTFAYAIHAADLVNRPRLVLCTNGHAVNDAIVGAQALRFVVITVPSLPARSDEMPRLISAIANEKAQDLGLSSPGFRPRDAEILGGISYSEIEDLENTIFRVVVLRHWGVYAGAKRLGITHPTLSQWARHRRIPT